MAIESLQDALVHEMRDLLSAERQFKSALGKLAKSAGNEELSQAFADHQQETANHITRLEQAFGQLGVAARAKKCEAAAGLVEEGAGVMEEDGEEDALDALLITAAQKVEHYEIAAYGTVCEWCDMLGLTEVGDLLKENLSEEKAADEKLKRIAEGVNQAAMHNGGGEDDNASHSNGRRRSNGRRG